MKYVLVSSICCEPPRGPERGPLAISPLISSSHELNHLDAPLLCAGLDSSSCPGFAEMAEGWWKQEQDMNIYIYLYKVHRG